MPDIPGAANERTRNDRSRNIPKGIEAADSMLKTADVSLLTAQAVCAGKYIVLISGDVAAVTARAWTRARLVCGAGLIDKLVIPSIHPQVLSAVVACSRCAGTGALGIMETFSLCVSDQGCGCGGQGRGYLAHRDPPRQRARRQGVCRVYRRCLRLRGGGARGGADGGRAGHDLAVGRDSLAEYGPGTAVHLLDQVEKGGCVYVYRNE